MIASLWKANDASTVGLMTAFDDQLERSKLPPGKALRQAKLKLARGEFQEPYYWAASVAVGDRPTTLPGPAGVKKWWKVLAFLLTESLLLVGAKWLKS